MAVGDLYHTNNAGETLNLNDELYFFLQAIRGIYHDPHENITQDIPYRVPRSILLANNPLARQIEVDLLVRRHAMPGVISARRRLVKHFHRDARDTAMGTLDYTAPSEVAVGELFVGTEGVRRIIDVFPVSDTEDAREWTFVDFEAQSIPWITLTLTFVAPIPWFYDYVQTILTANLNGTANVAMSCPNPGDEDVYPEIVFHGQATNVRVTDGYGNWTELTQTITAGQWMRAIFDPNESSFTRDNGAAWWNYRAAGSIEVMVRSGTHNLVFRGGNAGDNALVDVRYRPAYASHGYWEDD